MLRPYCGRRNRRSSGGRQEGVKMSLKGKDKEKCETIIDARLRMNALVSTPNGFGKISLRHGEGMLGHARRHAVPGDAARQIVDMHLDGSDDPAQRSSSEWRSSRDILKADATCTPSSTPTRPTDDVAIMGMGFHRFITWSLAPAATPSAVRRTRPSAPRNCRNMPFVRWKAGWPAFSNSRLIAIGPSLPR